MTYTNNYQEKPPKKLLPAGWRVFLLTSAQEGTSKQGKPKVVVDLLDKESGYIDEQHLSTQPGTAWVWARLIRACGIAKDVSFEVGDIRNKAVVGLVEHEPNEYINREGDTIKGVQHRITDFKAYEDETEKIWNGENA